MLKPLLKNCIVNFLNQVRVDLLIKIVCDSKVLGAGSRIQQGNRRIEINSGMMGTNVPISYRIGIDIPDDLGLQLQNLPK